MKIRRLASITGIVGGILCVLAIVTIYRAPRWSDGAIMLGKTLNIPVARVADHRIGFREFFREYDAVKRIIGSDASPSSIADGVLARLQDEYITSRLASTYRVRISGDELDLYHREMIASATTSDPFLRSAYVRDHIVRTLLLKDRLVDIFLGQPNPAFDKASQLRMQLIADTSSEPFDGTGATTAVSGSETLIAATDLGPEHLQIFRALTDGEVTPIVIEHDGYYLYKIVKHFIDPQEVWQTYEYYVQANPFDAVYDQYASNHPILLYVKKSALAS